MLNLLLTESSVVASVGIPQYFFKDIDLCRIIADVECQKHVHSILGDCCIGRLGTLSPKGVYTEVYGSKDVDVQERGDLGYYDKIL